MRIERAGEDHRAAWIRMRQALWPDDPATGQHAWLALDDDTLLGFAEATLRRDYVNGCDTSPVAFLEGIYVAPEHRRRGVARALVDAIAEWARSQGVAEFASDALLDNHDGHALHAALGFIETERVVYFRRELTPP